MFLLFIHVLNTSVYKGTLHFDNCVSILTIYWCIGILAFLRTRCQSAREINKSTTTCIFTVFFYETGGEDPPADFILNRKKGIQKEFKNKRKGKRKNYYKVSSHSFITFLLVSLALVKSRANSFLKISLQFENILPCF